MSTMSSTLITTLLSPFAMLLTLLPHRIQIRLLILRDLLTSTFNLVFGRRLSPIILDEHLPHHHDQQSSSISAESEKQSIPPSTSWSTSSAADLLRGKTALVTGSNSGIGLQITLDLASRGCTVILACRSESKAKDAVADITSQIPGCEKRVSWMKLDTSSLASVRELAKHWTGGSERRPAIDILVHNAGCVGPTKETGDFTAEGFEITYATNFLGSFLLTYLLEPYLAVNARVVFTSSFGHNMARFGDGFDTGPVKGVVEEGFHFAPRGVVSGLIQGIKTLGPSGGKKANESAGGKGEPAGAVMSRYGNSKAMQVAFAKLLQERFDVDRRNDGARRTAHAFSPGLTTTAILGKADKIAWWKEPVLQALRWMMDIATDVDQGAATGSWLCMTDDERVVGRDAGGRHWERMEVRLGPVDALDRGVLRKMWTRWENDSGVEWS